MYDTSLTTIKLLVNSAYNHTQPRSEWIEKTERRNFALYKAGVYEELCLRDLYPKVGQVFDIDLIEGSFFAAVIRETVEWHAKYACNVHTGDKIKSMSLTTFQTDYAHKISKPSTTSVSRRTLTYILQLAAAFKAFPTNQKFETWSDLLCHIEAVVQKHSTECYKLYLAKKNNGSFGRMHAAHLHYLNCRGLTANSNWYGKDSAKFRYGVPADITSSWHTGLPIQQLFDEFVAYVHDQPTGECDWSSIMTARSFKRVNPDGSTRTVQLSGFILYSLASLSLRLRSKVGATKPFEEAFGQLEFIYHN